MHISQSESPSQGTPSSNTVPYNYNNEYFKLLRIGVDSLSYQGELFPEVKERLAKLKQLAQHPEVDNKLKHNMPLPVISLKSRIKGSSIFLYVMEDGVCKAIFPVSMQY